jgi:hypothetical protein
MVCLASLLDVVPVLAIPSLPSSFYGIVKVNNANVADGTLVQALIGGQVFAKGHTQTYQGDSVYALDVPGDDTDTIIKEGGRDGDTIQFQIGGVVADQTGTWRSGTNVNQGLSASSAATLTAPEATLTPVPTQTAILAVQLSPTSITPTKSPPTPANLIQPSPMPTPRIQPSPTPISPVEAENGLSKNVLIVAIIVIVVIASGLIFIAVRGKMSMVRKSK